MAPAVKIRGIYTTAFTRLFLDSGYPIAAPSEEIRRRFRMEESREAAEVVLKDREDRQGVDLIGEADAISQALGTIRERLLDAVLMKVGPLPKRERLLLDEPEIPMDLDHAWVELGGASRETLDRLRASVLPSLARHHRLRILHPLGLEKAESQLKRMPDTRPRLERDLFHEAVLDPLRKTGMARLEHRKVSGRPVRPREGVLQEVGDDRIVLRRSFSQGRYDGLDLPIAEGDYGLTEVREGFWFVKHAYFSKEGKLKGEYLNVNTPVELYPHGARYLDLEVDVVRRPGECPCVVDRENLTLLAREGKIGPQLEKKALEVAEELMKALAG